MTTKIRAVEVAQVGAPLKLVDLERVDPGRGQVRIAIEACGICHSDYDIAQGWFGGDVFPLTPGHEIAGRIDSLGDYVEGWNVGDRVSVGWFGGNCGHCLACREGDLINCVEHWTPGISYQGGYAESIVVPASAPAHIPDGLSFVEAAPMGCAGVTVFNALRRTSARPGDLVAILGVGGLGHLGVQFANRMGFDTVAIARGEGKEVLARELGANHYIDSTAQNVADSLQALGGARVVIATVAEPAAITATIDGLRARGELVVIGVSPERIQVSPVQLIVGQKTLRGHASGTAREIEETLRFAALSGVRSLSEEVSLDQAPDAFEKMLKGAARFRMVLTTAIS